MLYVKLTEGSKRGIYYWYKSHFRSESPEYKRRKIGAEMDAEALAIRKEKLEKLRREEEAEEMRRLRLRKLEAMQRSREKRNTPYPGMPPEPGSVIDRPQGPTP